MPVWVYILAGAALATLVGLVLYWQLVIAEGAYLGPHVVARLYDWFAPHYDRVKQFDKAGDAIMLATPIIQHIVIRAVPNPLVLDVATGTGRLPDVLLSQRRFRGRIVALDLSGRMLDQARAKLAAHVGRVTFMQHDAQRLPFDAATFDVVTCLEALEFMRDWRGAVREMLRVLKPGGLLMVSNRIGPDAWKLPGRTLSTAAFVAWLCELGLRNVHPQPWLVDYDLVTGVKP
ncbi:MAG: class I SAM-dependent methyltransferase [Thermoflexales bacterium]|nr:class I SAM-dependent methyltransferase [Thermoflexales bacterium]MDW8351617.1 class I SAM-dependent methyltransferase [Anaerolineae bacterium]